LAWSTPKFDVQSYLSFPLLRIPADEGGYSSYVLGTRIRYNHPFLRLDYPEKGTGKNKTRDIDTTLSLFSIVREMFLALFVPDVHKCEDAKSSKAGQQNREHTETSAYAVHNWSIIKPIKLEDSLGITPGIRKNADFSGFRVAVSVHHESTPSALNERSPAEPFPSLLQGWTNDKRL
jgi:hypothetical protein